MKLYLAGKVGGNKWTFAKALPSTFTFVASDGDDDPDMGHRGDLRTDHGYNSTNTVDQPTACSDLNWLDTKASEKFCSLIAGCSGLVAYLDTADSYGSIAEIAYASARGLPCHAFVIDDDSLEFHQRAFYRLAPGTPAAAVMAPTPQPQYIDLPTIDELFAICEKPPELLADEDEQLRDWHERRAEELEHAEVEEVECAYRSPKYDAYWFVLSLPNVTVYVCCDLDDALIEFSSAFRTHALINRCESPIESTFYRVAARSLPDLVPQHKVGPYRLDFAIPPLKVCVELDGHDFHKTKDQRTRDASRQRWLQINGWQVIRFTGTEIHKDVNRCVRETARLVEMARRNVHAMA